MKYCAFIQLIMEACLNFNKRFCLDFIQDLRTEDKKIIWKAVNIFKKTDQIIGNEINFLEERDLTILLEFFSRYGEDIRRTPDPGCLKVEGFCVCFMNEELTDSDYFNIQQAVSISRGEAQKNNNFLLLKDRDIKIITKFFAKYGNIIYQPKNDC